MNKYVPYFFIFAILGLFTWLACLQHQVNKQGKRTTVAGFQPQKTEQNGSVADKPTATMQAQRTRIGYDYPGKA